MDPVGSSFFEKARDSGCVVRRCTTWDPVMRGDAHTHGPVLRPHGTHRGENLKRIAAAILDTPAVRICPLIGQWRYKAGHEISVGTIKFQPVKASSHPPPPPPPQSTLHAPPATPFPLT